MPTAPQTNGSQPQIALWAVLAAVVLTVVGAFVGAFIHVTIQYDFGPHRSAMLIAVAVAIALALSVIGFVASTFLSSEASATRKILAIALAGGFLGFMLLKLMT